ncbi:hypothetical protein, partial [Gordonia paraffinivorans]|uniref:hypothetical protein n=1 Tax=Gordonia paraffinivorans TaxID=175628 RepID=UPI001C92C527
PLLDEEVEDLLERNGGHDCCFHADGTWGAAFKGAASSASLSRCLCKNVTPGVPVVVGGSS